MGLPILDLPRLSAISTDFQQHGRSVFWSVLAILIMGLYNESNELRATDIFCYELARVYTRVCQALFTRSEPEAVCDTSLRQLLSTQVSSNYDLSNLD
jgi:hypothetical protein